MSDTDREALFSKIKHYPPPKDLEETEAAATGNDRLVLEMLQVTERNIRENEVWYVRRPNPCPPRTSSIQLPAGHPYVVSRYTVA